MCGATAGRAGGLAAGRGRCRSTTLPAAGASRDAYAERLAAAGFGPITTEIADAGEFYFAEDYHRQYLARKTDGSGYCPNHSTGVSCSIGLRVAVTD